ncbi:MAG: response regulator [Saprospiraceae bacterium]|nr:response regulator [Saprospiraceae bacterium]
MKSESSLKIFLVDDDAVFLKFLELEFLHHPEFIIETYATGELCMASILHNPDVIVLDYNLDGMNKNAMNGIETLHKIKQYNPNIQVIVLSQQEAIDVAINAIQYKAIDYVVKGENAFSRIKKIITTILNFKNIEKSQNWYTGAA